MDKKYINKIEDFEVIRVNVDEAETTINISRGENTADIYTSDNVMLTKLKKQMIKNPEWKAWEAGRNQNGEITGYFFQVPKRTISIRAGIKKVVSEERRQAAAERFKKVRAKKNVERNN